MEETERPGLNYFEAARGCVLNCPYCVTVVELLGAKDGSTPVERRLICNTEVTAVVWNFISRMHRF